MTSVCLMNDRLGGIDQIFDVRSLEADTVLVFQNGLAAGPIGKAGVAKGVKLMVITAEHRNLFPMLGVGRFFCKCSR